MKKDLLRRKLRILYPAGEGRIVLRCEKDWDRDIDPVRVEGGEIHHFELAFERPILHYKPCLRRGGPRVEGGELHWAQGSNKLLFMGSEHEYSVYPHFGSESAGRISEIVELPSAILGRSHRLRIYHPAGYDENELKRYPVLYMQDGANAFFPDEAFMGRDWQVDETLDLLQAMNLIDQTLVVGIYAEERNTEYTKPGYEAYGRSLVDELKPWVDATLRTLPGREYTSALGSSLGGVVSFYLGWQYPEVFGNVACMSSSFGWRDDLIGRVRSEDPTPRRRSSFYLDSGWPGDNYEVTLAMAVALVERSFVLGRDVHHFAFPMAQHEEDSWGSRCHLPLQLFTGRLRRVDRKRAQVEALAGDAVARK